jgi:lysophospholipase L1-like esterase
VSRAVARTHRRGTVRVAVAVVALLLGVSWAAPSPVAAQERRIVVVGDSVILGAQSAMVGAFTNLGWAVTFDAAVSRSTAAGAEAIESHRAELTDTLVVNLGANDAGNTAAYRQRVEQIFASTTGVPNVYWLTIREVRDYYPAANQAVREAAAAHPNVTVLDWNAATAGSSGLTSSDGLHLTGAGAAAMTDLVTAAVFGSQPAFVAPPPETTPVPPTSEVPPITEAPPVTEAPTTTVAPTTTTITTTVPPTTGVLTPSVGDRRTEAPRRDESAEATPASAGGGGAIGWTIGGVALVVALLAVGGAALGGWALVATRDGGGDATASAEGPTGAPPAPSERHQEEAGSQQS